MNPRFAAAFLAGLVAIVCPLPARAGGAPPGSQSAAGQTQRVTWRTIITVGSAGGLAIDRRGDPSRTKWGYIVNSYDRTVIKFGTGGRRLASWKYSPPAQYVSPAGIAVGGSGNVFVADGGNNRVVKFDPFGRQLAVFSGFNMPAGVAIDRSGNIYIAEETGLRVTKLAPSGQVLARWHVPWATGTGTGVPLAIAVDQQGNVYVAADCYRDECPEPHGIQYAVIKLSPSGTMQGSLLGNNPYVAIGPGEQPFVTLNSIAVDNGGTVYVGSSAIRDPKGIFYAGILLYTGALSRQRIYTLPGNAAPTGIAFDGRNAIYVTQGTRVLKATP